MTNKKIIPLYDKILVRRIEVEEKTASGLFIPDTAKEKPQQGKVIAVGPGNINDDGKHTPLCIKEGDVILFAKWSGTEVFAGEDLLIMKESDVLAIIKE